MLITCKNCGQKYEGNFCNNCGQKADTQRIDFKFFKKRIERVLFKFSDKGIFYTVRQLFTRPGIAAREYIEGKRVNHYDPLSLLILLAASYGILYHYFGINFFSNISTGGESTVKIDFIKVNEWFSNHFSLANGIMIPLYSIGSYAVFRNQGYNYTEHLTLNTFLACQRLLLRLFTFPLIVIFHQSDNLQILEYIFIGSDITLLVWSYSQFFDKLTKPKVILLSLLSYLIFFICTIALIYFLIYTLSLIPESIFNILFN
ncbi:MAG: DUF3667 domain-containing protein [Ignavibacteria bacterium]|nr:DUF3667 domain-containing protein [Ignavibacteria bacterium]